MTHGAVSRAVRNLEDHLGVQPRTSEMAAIQVTGEAQFDSAALRRAFGSFPTGVTVVTTLDADGRPRGMTANSFASVSLDPALLLVCIGHGAASFSAFAQCRSFAVNVLRDDQQDVSSLFASKSAMKFAASPTRRATPARPCSRLPHWFDCTVHQRWPAITRAVRRVHS